NALAQYGPNLLIAPSSPAATLILDLVKASVPEAVDLLGATDKWILNAATSKLALSAAATSVVAPTPLPPSPAG
ncbi:MAG TPA: hypothetical protein VL418_10735, partial [Devosiaceae bacterium]|nr:hypothetical protein [Devosiaceae bacterium]